MKKVLSILMVAFAVTAMVACGGNSGKPQADGVGETTENAAGSQADLLPTGTYSFADAEYSYGLQLLEKMLNYSIITIGNGSMTTVIYSGPHAYDASTHEGSAEMKDSHNGSDAGQATFSFDPASETVTITFQGKTVTLEKQQPVKL